MQRSRRRNCLAVILAFVASFGAEAEAQGQEEPQTQSDTSAAGADDAESAEPPVELSDAAALARATTYYETGQYEECILAFEELLDPSSPRALSSPGQIESARIHYAACLMAEGRMEEADAQFRAAVAENPQLAVPSSLVFPQAVIDRFIVVREQMMDEIREAQERQARRARKAALEAKKRAEAERRRIAELERLASQETLVVKNRRWLASVPFGVGQFQNREYGLGAFFLTSEVVMLGTALTAVSIQLSLHSQANGGQGLTEEREVELNRNLDTAHVVTWAATGGFVTTALIGIIEANLSFVPEFREGVRQRPKQGKPKNQRGAVSITPLVGPVRAGAQVGITGRF